MPELDKKLQKYLFCLYIFSVSVFAAYCRAVSCQSEMKTTLSVFEYWTYTELNWSGCDGELRARRHSDMLQAVLMLWVHLVGVGWRGEKPEELTSMFMIKKMRVISILFSRIFLLHFKSSPLRFPRWLVCQNEHYVTIRYNKHKTGKKSHRRLVVNAAEMNALTSL